MNYALNDTICAPATATGGALAIIRISGPEAITIASSVCRGSSVRGITPTTPGNTVHYAHVTTPPPVEGGRGETIDEAVVTIFRAPHSYTGEDSVEISCHGSRYIINKVLELLVQQGCRMARPGEFTQRAYLNGKLDLSQAEAVADLIASTNQATHHLAMSQLRGGISTELSRLRDHLLKLTSLLELELDFADHEDLEFADRTELLDLAQTIEAHIAHLAQSFETGQALKQGIPVAIIGAPNVGKSTLLNALLGEERAIVSDVQGTTRDVIEDAITLRGVTFRFIDTAGIRHTTDTVEQMGIERTLSVASRARIIIMLTEPGVSYPDVPVRDEQVVIRIENKTPAFQAKYAIGLEALKEQLTESLPTYTDGDVIITNARHYEVLQRAQVTIQRVIEGLHCGLSGDLLSEDLRQTLDILAEITGGQITPQETLNNIFSHFCVGK